MKYLLLCAALLASGCAVKRPELCFGAKYWSVEDGTGGYYQYTSCEMVPEMFLYDKRSENRGPLLREVYVTHSSIEPTWGPRH